MKLHLAAILTATFFTAASMAAEESLITLDLTKSTTPLSFNEQTGAWTGTYDDDEESIESQCFSFVHNSMADYNTWWGFTASNSADNSSRTDYITYQFSNMAKGGIELNENGTVALDDFGAPVVNPEVPYLVAYYSSFMSRRPVDMTFNREGSFEAVEVYINLNSYTYYSVEDGYYPARPFTNSDALTLTIHGVAPDGSEKEVVVTPASYSNGDLTINRGWRRVDLSSLGTIDELYFTMDSTDTGSWGPNTPLYFCMDKLTVRETTMTGIEAPVAAERINYDRESKNVTVEGAGFAQLLTASGEVLLSTDEPSFSISAFPAGVYIVRTPHSSLKIAK
ncbi:MAG: DUF4465 domain-containing protein [Bacteroides sp.]|nr:DUF4465 domain-containing protein [Bacteroides sp.]